MAQFASDDFAGADGTTLSTYNADWTRHTSYSGDMRLISGRVRMSSATTSAYYHSGTPSSADYSVSADLVFRETDGGNGHTYVAGRVNTAANTMYIGGYSGGSNDFWVIQKAVSGTFTVLSSSASGITDEDSHNLRLEMVGTAIKMYIDGSGTALISVTDSAITSAGKSGIRMAGTIADTTGIHLDNFSADDIASGITGTGTLTTAAVTASGTGTIAHTGTGSPSITAVTASGTGTLAHTGTGAIATGAATASGSGTVASGVITGTGAVTVGAVTASGAGVLTHTGTGALSSNVVSITGAGSLTHTGTGAATTTAATVSGGGFLGTGVTGTGSITIGNVVVSGTGNRIGWDVAANASGIWTEQTPASGGWTEQAQAAGNWTNL